VARGAADPEAPGAEAARHGGERGHVLLVVPGVEVGLRLRQGVHREEQHRLRTALGRRPVSRQRLLRLEAADALALAGDALRPRREVFPGDRAVGWRLQHGRRFEVVGRDRDPGVFGAYPALAVDEALDRPTPRYVLRVVPVVELVFGHGGKIESRDQQSHRRFSQSASSCSKKPQRQGRQAAKEKWIWWTQGVSRVAGPGSRRYVQLSFPSRPWRPWR